MPEFNHINVARCIVLDPAIAGNILVGRRRPNANNNPNLLENFGGQVEPNDIDLTAAAGREISQELSVVVHPLFPFVKVFERTMRGGSREGRKHHTYGSIAVVASGIPQLSEEHSEIKSVPLPELLARHDVTEVSRHMLQGLMLPLLRHGILATMLR